MLAPINRGGLLSGQEKQDLDYETARNELVEVVRKLEAGGLPLEDSLALWERGETLAAVCERHLAGARARVESALASVESVDGGLSRTNGGE
jgi:exodeoxyribonuclease VII small subunit